MKQVALPAGFDGRSPFELRGAEFHHLARVRRVDPGARLRGRTSDGRAFELEVREVGRDSMLLAAVGPGPDSEPPEWEITLLQCVPRGPRFDQIVRQAVEAGVSRIVPVVSERSLAGDWSQRLGRLRRIAREAMEQSGAPRLTVLEEPVPLGSVAAGPGRICLFLHEKPLAALEGTGGFVYSPRSVEPSAAAARAAAPPGLHDHLAEATARVDLLVGPEGGLAASEVTCLLRAGFRPVYLGDTVLRVETAAIFALGAVKTLLLERERWTVRRPQ